MNRVTVQASLSRQIQPSAFAAGGMVARRATGATLGMTYFGVVVGPFLYWAIVAVSASYAIAFAAVGVCALVAGLACFRRLERS